MLKDEPLAENVNVRQRPEEGFRRWFVNSYFDLILWYDAQGGDLTGFQICYSRNKWEREFTWTRQYASSHLVSDSFIEAGVSPLSAGVLQGDGGMIPESVVARFEADSADSTELERGLRTFIVEKIREYNVNRASKA
jgi:hypothetical protein